MQVFFYLLDGTQHLLEVVKIEGRVQPANDVYLVDTHRHRVGHLAAYLVNAHYVGFFVSPVTCEGAQGAPEFGHVGVVQVHVHAVEGLAAVKGMANVAGNGAQVKDAAGLKHVEGVVGADRYACLYLFRHPAELPVFYPVPHAFICHCPILQKANGVYQVCSVFFR